MPTLCAESSGPRVVAVHPACAVWPANILRIHVVFDRPMDRDGALDRLRIETARGATVAGALVDLPDGLWTPDQRVLTALLHPARVKRGLGERERRGRALEPGRGYAFVVDGAMADAEGRPLGVDYRAPFTAGAPVESTLDPGRWSIAQPDPGSLNPVVIETDRPLDALGVAFALRLRGPDGVPVGATFEAAGPLVLGWPRVPWPAGPLSIDSTPDLEDVCGNRRAEAFERIARARP